MRNITKSGKRHSRENSIKAAQPKNAGCGKGLLQGS